MSEILLYDEIGGWGTSARSFIESIQACAPGERVTVRINSPGGSVTEGFAIANEIKRRKDVTCSIDGLCASIATIIAIAGDRVEIADGAMMMIHNVWTVAQGDADELREQADNLEKFQEAAVNAYVQKTGLSKKRITDMMDAETWLTAQEAYALGFVDEIAFPLASAARATAIKHATAHNLTRALKSMSTKAAPETATEETPVVETVVEEPAKETLVPPAETPESPDETTVPADAIADDVTVMLAGVREQGAALLDAQNKVEALTAEVAQLKAKCSELETLKTNFAKLKASLGLAPVVAPVAVVPQEKDADSAFIEKWKAADPQQQVVMYRENTELVRRLNEAGRLNK